MLRLRLVRSYRAAWFALAVVAVFTGVGSGVVLLRTWTLFFLAVTAVCLALSLSAALSGNGNPDPGAISLSLLIFGSLVGISGLVMLVEWVAFAIVGALAVAAIPLRGGRGQSTQRLCARWQETLHSLRAATTTTEAAVILRTRQRFLDEMERRHPEAFHRWLATPDADPATILRPRQGSL
ncbi:hypothetical protein [Actinokineospora inagensis]|uniref:hypothetical protein n=1 Tax=Actinokineospora inagensis TaxID=103730 RepID=UPI0003F81877|nr:hypothetical protein [Actinokineospora inagensis]